MKISEKEKRIIEEAIRSSRSMSAARVKIGCSRSWLQNRAVKLGLWQPADLKKLEPINKLQKEDLLMGNFGQLSSHFLKKKLIDCSLLKDECCKCGWKEKRSGTKYSSCHLDHIDGDHTNNRLENLRILCPNCHSLTVAYSRRKTGIRKTEFRAIRDGETLSSTLRYPTNS